MFPGPKNEREEVEYILRHLDGTETREDGSRAEASADQIIDAARYWGIFHYVHRELVDADHLRGPMFRAYYMAQDVLTVEAARYGLDPVPILEAHDLRERLIGNPETWTMPMDLMDITDFPLCVEDPGKHFTDEQILTFKEAYRTLARLVARADANRPTPDGASGPLPRRLTPTDKIVAKAIMQKPGRTSENIRTMCSLSSNDVVRRSMANLKHYGFHTGANSRNYYPPNPIPMSLTVALQ
jgi:hypothetical protein